ncbi:MAG TPA: MoaD/ThiS family protein [Ktedonobacterales bacterium]|nr:MoaD/ThiS family protein [Ktedonobacterales bacterium]
MSTIRIPPVLRGSVGGVKQVNGDGATLRETLANLFESYPGLRTQIFTPEGDISKFINIYVDDQDVRYLQGLDSPTGASATITLLPALAGGARCDTHRSSN